MPILRRTILLIIVLAGYTSPVMAESIELLAEELPPYEISIPGDDNLRGIIIESHEAAFKRVGITVTFKYMPWARQLQMVKRGLSPGLTLCGHQTEREAYILFSNPIGTLTRGFWSRIDFSGPEPKTMEDVRGLRTGSVLEDANLDTLAKVDSNAKSFRTLPLALRALVKGSYDYLFYPMEITGYSAAKLGLSKALKFSEIQTRTFHLCLSKKWPSAQNLLEKFNDGLSQIKADGTYDMIRDKYR